MERIAAKDRIELATTIYRSLVAGHLSEKYRAAELLRRPDSSVDLTTLRTLLVKAINEDFYAGREKEQDDHTIADTRSWLLGTLGLIAAGSDEATTLVIKHTGKQSEPFGWARYWALEGLISGKHPKVEEVARTLAGEDDDPLVSMLATAVLSSLNDVKASQKIRKSLENSETQWYVLRALRIVPLPASVSAVSGIAERADYTDQTYDAIVALGRIPSDWSQSSRAAQALSACIIKTRGSPWKDGMRTAAITGLGNLRVETWAPLILEELADDNPAVAREAARSIERILGLSATVARTVEAAAKSGTAGVDAYARALRWLNRNAVADELETLMITGPATQQEIARTLLSEIGGVVAYEKLRARTDAMKQYTELLEKAEEKIRELFQGSIEEAQRGFHLAVTMDVLIFCVGLLLLLVSAGYAIFSTGDLAKWAGVGLSGGIGVLSVLYSVFIANPRRQVRESVDHLMRLKIVFLAYLRRLHQTDQAFTRLLLDNETVTVEQVKSFADVIGDIMEDTVRQQHQGLGPEKAGKGQSAKPAKAAERATA
jgi:hypothetical protein